MKFNCDKLLIGLISVVITACGGGKSEDYQSQYIDACAEHDFEKARSLAEKAALAERNSYRGDEHLQYVNDKEIYYLLADNSRDNADRIMFMYNSIDRNQLPRMTDVLEVATAQGNEYLAKKLVQGGVSPSRDVINAAMSNKMDDLLLLIMQSGNEGYWNDNLIEYAAGASPELANLAANYKEKKAEADAEREAQKAANDKESWDKTVKEALAFDGIPTRPATGRVKSDHYGDIPKEYPAYNKAVEAHNSACKKVLMEAISRKDKVAANKLIGGIKPVLEWNDIGDWAQVVEHSNGHSVYNAFQVTLSQEPINEAKEILRQAEW